MLGFRNLWDHCGRASKDQVTISDLAIGQVAFRHFCISPLCACSALNFSAFVSPVRGTLLCSVYNSDVRPWKDLFFSLYFESAEKENFYRGFVLFCFSFCWIVSPLEGIKKLCMSNM